jgi:hypothetical protein
MQEIGWIVSSKPSFNIGRPSQSFAGSGPIRNPHEKSDAETQRRQAATKQDVFSRGTG